MLSCAVSVAAVAEQFEVIAGSVPPGRETVLERIVHLETELHTEVPAVARGCDRMRPEGRLVDIGGVELFVEQEGPESGEGPALVLLHGGPGGTHHYFHPWFSRVAEFAHVVYYDQRGCGLSEFEPGDDGYSVEQAVADLDALREALGIEQWVLFGYSYGGFLGQLYATRHPERVAGLVLHGALPGVKADLGAWRQEIFFSPEEKERKGSILEEIRALRDSNDWSPRQTLQLLVYNWGLNGDWKRQNFLRPSRDRLAQRALYEWDHDDGFNATVSGTVEAIDLTGAFETSPFPTLVLEGEWDLTWGEAKRSVLASNHPRARLMLFENAGHNIYKEQPKAFLDVLREFLGSLPKISPEAVEAYREALRRSGH